MIHYDAPFWLALQCFFAQWVTHKVYKKLSLKLTTTALAIRHFLKIFIVSSLASIASITVLTLMIEVAFGRKTIDNHHIILTLITTFLLHTLNSSAILAIKIFKNINQQQLSLEKAQNNLLEINVKQLQQQLDPHFLFNNLNVLSALIISKPYEAEKFLDAFSNIYRYIIDNQHKNTIVIDKEINFSYDYMELLRKRFANAFYLTLSFDSQDTLHYKTLPCSLQLALENVIKHNQGDTENPLNIEVRISNTWLIIKNPIRPKTFATPSSGLGLNNLKLRAKAILRKPIQIEQNEHQFTLKIPVIQG